MSSTICTIDFPTELGRCNIIVPDSDSDIAYFEINNGSKVIKIKTFEPEYFEDNDYILNKKEKEVLNETLRDAQILGEEPWQRCQSHWQWIAFMWDEVNEDSNYEQKDQEMTKDKQPNYLSL